MRHYTDKSGEPVTAAHHTGYRCHLNAKSRNRNPDVIVARDDQGRLFYGDTKDDYSGATEIACTNCRCFVAAEHRGPPYTRDLCDGGSFGGELEDTVACGAWEPVE